MHPTLSRRRVCLRLPCSGRTRGRGSQVVVRLRDGAEAHHPRAAAARPPTVRVVSAAERVVQQRRLGERGGLLPTCLAHGCIGAGVRADGYN